jgi:hypothetical protein
MSSHNDRTVNRPYSLSPCWGRILVCDNLPLCPHVGLVLPSPALQHPPVPLQLDESQVAYLQVPHAEFQTDVEDGWQV